ncbi:hypothetical protein D3C81_931030 [compost metagenome]|jgi:hypothetical protein
MNREEIFNRDVFILISIVNMKLRDSYGSLEDYCYEEEVDRDALIERFSEEGYVYNSETNSFTKA